MTRDEALPILGLKPGATAAEIKAAHRRLMAGAHPDHGGSDWIAARLNQARDVLLG
jgi:curved DNA-binding protein CbpA